MKRFKSAIALLLLLVAVAQAQVGNRLYNLKIDFGAVGDGVADDTRAFNLAIATGDDFYIPEGTYVVTSGLTLSSNQRVFGDGKTKTILVIAEDGLGEAVVTMADGSELHDLQIRETGADPQKTTTTNDDVGVKNGTASDTVVEGVYVKGLKYPFTADDSTGVADNVLYEDCEVSHCYGWGFYVDGTSDVTYTKCLAHDCGLDGFKAGNDNGYTNSGLSYSFCRSHTNGRRDAVVGGPDSTNGNGFDLYPGGYRTVLTNCYAWGNIGSGFVAKGTDAGSLSGEIVLIASEFRDNLANNAGTVGHGIEINNSDSTLGSRVSIIGCLASGNTGEGIAIQGGNSIHIHGGSFVDNDRVGIRVTGAASDVSVSGAVIDGNWDGNVIVGSTNSATQVNRNVVVRDCSLWGTYSPSQVTGETPKDLNVDEFTFTADASTDTLTATSHTYSNGDRVNVTSTTTLPGGLSTKTWYYVVGVASNTLQLSDTYGGTAIDLTSSGTGTHTVAGKGSSIGARVYSDSAGVLFDGCVFGNVKGSNGAVRTGGDLVRILNSRFFNQNRSAIYATSGETYVERCFFSNINTDTDASWGVVRFNAEGHAKDNTFTNPSLLTNSRGVRFQSGSSGTFSGNSSTNYTTTVDVVSGAAISNVIYQSGSGSPSGAVTPTHIGELYLDTSGNAWYRSYGTVNTNWQAL